MPKSSTLTTTRGLAGLTHRKTLSGLRSRWTMPRRVGGGQRLRELRDHRQREGESRVEPRDASDVGRERLALEVLHHDERLLVDDVAVEHLDDPGMADRRRRARLAEETLEDGGLLRELREQHLDRSAALDAAVLGEIHPAHASPSQLPSTAYPPTRLPTVITTFNPGVCYHTGRDLRQVGELTRRRFICGAARIHRDTERPLLQPEVGKKTAPSATGPPSCPRRPPSGRRSERIVDVVDRAGAVGDRHARLLPDAGGLSGSSRPPRATASPRFSVPTIKRRA